MAIDPKTIFNQNFPPEVKEELNRRKNIASGVERGADFRKWNYNRYAYVSVTSTGENSLDLICSSEFTIGDGSINEQAGLDLYEFEGGIRRGLPILKSVLLDSDGSSDFTQATMWTAKVQFDVFTLDQLNKAENSFLRAGSVVRLDFGWRNETATPNSGFIDGTVTNFSFSANKDGSFSCDFEMVGANSLFSAERLEGTPAEEKENEERSKDGELEPYPNIVDTISLQHKIAFGIKPGEDYSDEQAADGKITLKGKNNEFALANIQESSGLFAKFAAKFGFDLNDQFIPYITLSGFIDRINKITQKSGNGKLIVCDSATTIGAFVPEMFSADPTTILFGAEMADYGESGDMMFGTTLSDFKSGNQADLSKIRISIPFLSEVYGELRTFKKSEAKETQTPPAVKDMLNKIFEKIEEFSGGLYQLRLYQQAYDDIDNVYIINKRVGYGGSTGFDINDVFTFEVLGEKSIIREMSLSTEFNAELQAAASTAGRSGGQSTEVPANLFENLYKDCNIKSKTLIDDKDRVTIQQIKVLKKNYGQGFESSMVENSKDKLKNYLIQNSNEIAAVKEEFAQIPYLINLSVTLDGIFGIPYFGRFTVDRLPATYSSDIYFGVTKINHSFDGQGDWSTQIEGVMKIKNNNG
jgi:hypothetical protein